jgi:Uma2 family endonuclease
MAEVVEGQRTFTVDEYHRMAEAGVIGPDERVELIRGVIRQMSPKGRRLSQTTSSRHYSRAGRSSRSRTR